MEARMFDTHYFLLIYNYSCYRVPLGNLFSEERHLFPRISTLVFPMLVVTSFLKDQIMATMFWVGLTYLEVSPR